MRTYPSHGVRARDRGFSLIDVMIAVVVLATGMLALAALQGTLVRNSAETRSRSQAAAVAEAVLGSVRGQADADLSWYDALTTANWSTQLTDAGITNPVSGTYGETFNVSAVVQRYVPASTVAACGADNIPCFRLATVADTTREIGEYKLVTTTVNWTDAAGEPHNITLSDVLSSLPSANSKELVNRDLDSSRRVLSGPKVRIPIPDDAGIIPIAVGDGRNTAATNPKPVLDTSFGTQDTKFDVLTYATADGAAEVQRRVETQAIACRCRFGPPTGVDAAATFFTTKVRPTTWSGSRYSTPKSAESEGVVVDDSWGSTDRGISQSPLCNDCCRDHQDPGSLAAGKPKFSPYRSEHNHFRIVGTTFEPVTTSADNYFEACRMIRVDGIWRAASDTRLEHMSLLETADFARSFIPNPVGTPSPVKRYENFVKQFLNDRTIPTANFDSNVPAVAALETANSLNTPAVILLQPSTLDRRFLHNRALYLDYLEPATRLFLESKLVNCTATPRVTCLLPFLPFVSINTTEIGIWTQGDADPIPADPAVKITVSNVGGTFGAPNTEPRRGKVQPLSGAVAGNTAYAYVSMDRTNAGLNGSATVNELEADETTDRLGDRQFFRFDDAAFTDADRDGTPDSVDNCAPPTANPSQQDTDADGRGNECDTDDDGDTVDDTGDNCPLIANLGQEDTDFTTGANPDGDGVRGDGIGDACDPDDDMDDDTVLDGDDNCRTEPNEDQRDDNTNGIGNVCERDRDGDGVRDNVDNCPDDANRDQLDTDRDGVGDVCDTVTNTRINFNVAVNISGQDLATVSPKPLVGWTVNATPATCTGSFTPPSTDTNPNPYVCTDAVGPSLDLLLNQYNRIVFGTPARVANPCGSGRVTVSQPVCFNYRLDSVRVNGTAISPFGPVVVNDGREREATKVNLPNVPDAASVDANFVLQTRRDLFAEGLNVGFTCGFTNEVVFKVDECR